MVRWSSGNNASIPFPNHTVGSSKLDRVALFDCFGSRRFGNLWSAKIPSVFWDLVTPQEVMKKILLEVSEVVIGQEAAVVVSFQPMIEVDRKRQGSARLTSALAALRNGLNFAHGQEIRVIRFQTYNLFDSASAENLDQFVGTALGATEFIGPGRAVACRLDRRSTRGSRTATCSS
jgi:hypothetical protein